MSDKSKSFAVPASKSAKSKRPSTVSATPSTSRLRVSRTSVKDNSERATANSRSKILNNTTLGDKNLSILNVEHMMPDFDSEQRQIAYGKFLRTMLEDCLVDEKIEREETKVDIQMGHLADRFQKTIEQLDKTNRRLKDINFVAEQNRLLALKNKHCNEFYNLTSESKADLLRQLNATEESTLDKLHTKNIDFGFNQDSGHKQLLDAINDAIDGLEQIKKNSKLDSNKFKEYEKSEIQVDNLEKDRMDIESLKADFEAKFPNFSQHLLKEASEKMSRMFMNDSDFADDDEDED